MCDELMSVVVEGPIEGEPSGFLPRAEQQELLEAGLSGLELGAWDRRIVAWLSGWETSTVITIASWLCRTRLPM